MAFVNPNSSSTSTTVPTMVNSIAHINPLPLLLSNMSSMMIVKLDYSNYIVWKHKIEAILETYFMIDAIDESAMALDQLLKDSSGNVTTEVNLAFSIGRIVNKHCSPSSILRFLHLFLLLL